MPAKGLLLRRLLRWSLVACCAVALWFLGHLGGRTTGVEHGRQEGVAAGKEQGLDEALGFLNLEKRDRLTVFAQSLVLERLGNPLGPALVGEQAIDAEMQRMVDEICEEIAPGTWNLKEGGGNRIEADGIWVAVQGDPRVVAEVDMYLKSKDDYLAWKRSGGAAP